MPLCFVTCRAQPILSASSGPPTTILREGLSITILRAGLSINFWNIIPNSQRVVGPIFGGNGSALFSVQYVGSQNAVTRQRSRYCSSQPIWSFLRSEKSISPADTIEPHSPVSGSGITTVYVSSRPCAVKLLNNDSPPPGRHVAVGRRGASKKDAAFRIDCNVISGVQDFHVCFWLSQLTVPTTQIKRKT